MTNEDIKNIERVYNKPFSEIDELEIPTYLRNKDEKEEIKNEHIKAEIIMEQSNKITNN